MSIKKMALFTFTGRISVRRDTSDGGWYLNWQKAMVLESSNQVDCVCYAEP